MPFWHVDAGAALMLVLLAAIEEGLACGVYGVPVEEERTLRELLAIPDDLTHRRRRHRRPAGRPDPGWSRARACSRGARRRLDEVVGGTVDVVGGLLAPASARRSTSTRVAAAAGAAPRLPRRRAESPDRARRRGGGLPRCARQRHPVHVRAPADRARARPRRRRRSSTACSRELGVEDGGAALERRPDPSRQRDLEPPADAGRGRGGRRRSSTSCPRARAIAVGRLAGEARGAVRPPPVARRRRRVRGRAPPARSAAAAGFRYNRPPAGTLSAPSLQPMKTYSAKPGEVTREWYLVDAEGQDARPARDADRRHAPRQAQAAVHPARRHRRLRRRRERREDRGHRQQARPEAVLPPLRLSRAACAAGRSASSSTAGRPRCSASR